MKLAEAYKKLLNIDINEGLIKTVPVEKAVNLLSRFLQKIDIPFDIESPYESQSAKYVRIMLTVSLEHLANPNYVTGNNINPKISEILAFTNNLGYFPSTFVIDGYHGKFTLSSFVKELSDYEGELMLQFEEKYDYEIPRSKLPPYVYHITSPSVVDKILKIGLTPHSRSKIATHPDRIYLCSSLDALGDIADMMDGFLHGNGTIILKVDVNKIPKAAKFYRDPNFSNDGSSDEGFYTYTNVPPAAIEIYKK